jgi:FAD synthase
VAGLSAAGAKFSGIDALRAQIERDREAARAWFGM